MENHYLKNISVFKLRNIENLNLPIKNSKNNSLIITGKNGSGKSTLLNEIAVHFQKHSENIASTIETHTFAINSYKKEITVLENKLSETFSSSNMKEKTREEIRKLKGTIEDLRTPIAFLDVMKLEINSIGNLSRDMKEGAFVFTYLKARRKVEFQKPEAVKANNFKKSYPLDSKSNSIFISTLVNLWTEKIYAKEDNDLAKAAEIDKWFINFEDQLKTIFQSPELKLRFDRKTLNFIIQLNENTQFDFNQLSDGYSAIIDIVSELLIRLHDEDKPSYLKPGIVLIDEIETHLHMELQKKVVPFLMSVFPNIQFVISTHSPFVLHSVDDVDIFDLETRKHWKNLALYPVDTIISNYFNINLNSEKVLSMLREYKRLSDLKEFDSPQFDNLKKVFDDLDVAINPEIAVAAQAIKVSGFKSSIEDIKNSNGQDKLKK